MLMFLQVNLYLHTTLKIHLRLVNVLKIHFQLIFRADMEAEEEAK